MPLTREALEYDIANTIIEDSEPEREAEEERMRQEWRRRRLENKAAEKTLAVRGVAPARFQSHTVVEERTESSVIVISGMCITLILS